MIRATNEYAMPQILTEDMMLADLKRISILMDKTYSTVTSSHPHDEMTQAFSLAYFAVVRDLLRSIIVLVQHGRVFSATALLRTLVEHVIDGGYVLTDHARRHDRISRYHDWSSVELHRLYMQSLKVGIIPTAQQLTKDDARWSHVQSKYGWKDATRHWSGKTLVQRARAVDRAVAASGIQPKVAATKMYLHTYRFLSWNTHATHLGNISLLRTEKDVIELPHHSRPTVSVDDEARWIVDKLYKVYLSAFPLILNYVLLETKTVRRIHKILTL
jgi:hypothetical protein